jgi:hypothetical protein
VDEPLPRLGAIHDAVVIGGDRSAGPAIVSQLSTINLLAGFAHCLHAFLHLLRRDSLFVSSHPPDMPEGILKLAGAVAIELVLRALRSLAPAASAL